MSVHGNSATATKLETARKIKLVGDVVGEANFDGNEDINISAKQSNTAVLEGIITVHAGASTSTTINYPEGFNKDNTAIMSCGLKINGGTRGYSYGYSSEVIFNMPLAIDEKYMTLSEGGIKLTYKNQSDTIKQYDYRIVLLKIN